MQSTKVRVGQETRRVGLPRGVRTMSLRCARAITLVAIIAVAPAVAASGSATSSLDATTYSPGTPLKVTIAVVPGASVMVYALEDAPPTGWSVSGIDNGGLWDGVNKKVKWGPFFDNLSRTLSYYATPPSGENGQKTFTGTASFDGQNVTISGARDVSSPGSVQCTPDTTHLCLNASRFQVWVDWTNYNTGVTAAGNAVPYTTDTGIFWFFGATNVELVVKILDGRSVNGQFWVIFGSLTDVGFSMSIRDTQTGVVRIYSNPAHSMASRADVTAF